MGLKVKNFNILGIHGRTRVLGEVSQKANMLWDCLKVCVWGGLGQLADLREVAWQEIEGWCF